MNRISMTGRGPAMAAPAPMPVKPASLSGVSMTRSGPNWASRPSVTLNEPPRSAMPSPMTNTSGSRVISS